MRRRLSDLAALALAVLVVTFLLLALREQQPEVHGGAATGAETPAVVPAMSAKVEFAQPSGFKTDGPVSEPLHVRSKLPPFTRIEIDELPPVDHGIPMPDGSFLPLLNGMTQAPPVQRHRRLGPITRVVARMVDSEGFEWWVHADGSATTSKYQQVVLHDGRTYWDPASFHHGPVPASSLMKAPNDVPPPADGH